MRCKLLFSIFCFCCSALPAQAIEKMYGVVGVGFTDAEYSETVEETVSYKLVLGHQFHRQWYFEGGYYQIADVESDNNSFTFQADALYFGALGKASHAVGELFYRIGVASVNVQAIESSGINPCTTGDAIAVIGESNVCAYDESVVAGILGLGFDYYVATKIFVRFEAEYLRGKDGFDVSIFSIGLRYNFN